MLPASRVTRTTRYQREGHRHHRAWALHGDSASGDTAVRVRVREQMAVWTRVWQHAPPEQLTPRAGDRARHPGGLCGDARAAEMWGAHSKTAASRVGLIRQIAPRRPVGTTGA